MANLPDLPSNTVVAIALVAGAGLMAYNSHQRMKIERQVHDNYRHAKEVDAGVNGGPSTPTVRPGRAPAPRTA